MGQNYSLGKDKGPTCIITYPIQVHIIFFKFFFCIVHNKYLETDVSTNQKVFIKYSVG